MRQTLGRKTLEEILADKTDVDETVAAVVRTEMSAIGVQVGTISLKDIILPGDVREIMNQVVSAEKQAQANLIRRREETAATRSLLNTAKLLEDNPILVRLKELETLEKLVEKVDRVSVSGGFEGLLENLMELQTTGPEAWREVNRTEAMDKAFVKHDGLAPLRSGPVIASRASCL